VPTVVEGEGGANERGKGMGCSGPEGTPTGGEGRGGEGVLRCKRKAKRRRHRSVS